MGGPLAGAPGTGGSGRPGTGGAAAGCPETGDGEVDTGCPPSGDGAPPGGTVVDGHDVAGWPPVGGSASGGTGAPHDGHS